MGRKGGGGEGAREGAVHGSEHGISGKKTPPKLGVLGETPFSRGTIL